MSETLLTVADVAARLHCSKSLVYALKDRGEIGFVAVAGLVRFTDEDVAEFVKHKHEKAKRAAAARPVVSAKRDHFPRLRDSQPDAGTEASKANDRNA